MDTAEAQLPEVANALSDCLNLVKHNAVSPQDLGFILSAVEADPWLEAEDFSGDLLYELKRYFKRHGKSDSLQAYQQSFDKLFRSVAPPPIGMP